MSPKTKLTDKEFQYVPAAATDVRMVWARHGYVGPEALRSMRQLGAGVGKNNQGDRK